MDADLQEFLTRLAGPRGRFGHRGPSLTELPPLTLPTPRVATPKVPRVRAPTGPGTLAAGSVVAPLPRPPATPFTNYGRAGAGTLQADAGARFRAQQEAMLMEALKTGAFRTGIEALVEKVARAQAPRPHVQMDLPGFGAPAPAAAAAALPTATAISGAGSRLRQIPGQLWGGAKGLAGTVGKWGGRVGMGLGLGAAGAVGLGLAMQHAEDKKNHGRVYAQMSGLT